jgi:peroxin-1
VETIEMDPEVASGLGWREGDMVEVGIVRQAARGRSVSVTPATSDDWEVLVSSFWVLRRGRADEG